MRDWDDRFDDSIFEEQGDRFDGGGSGAGKVIAAVAVICLIALAIAGVGLLIRNRQQDAEALRQEAVARHVAAREDQEAREAALRDAFAAEPNGAAAPAADLEGFLTQLSAASRDEDLAALTALADIERFVDRAIQIGDIRTDADGEAAWRAMLRNQLAFDFRLHDHRTVTVQDGIAPDHKVVYVNFLNEDDDTLVLRIWVVQTPAGWKFYDWERLDYGISDAMLSAIVVKNVDDPKMWEYTFFQREMNEFYDLIEADNKDAAIEILNRAEQRDVIPDLRGLMQLQVAYGWTWVDEIRRSLDACDRVRDPQRTPGIFSTQASMYGAWGHNEKVVVAANNYEQFAGIDPTVVMDKADALFALYRPSECIESLQKLLRIDPNHTEALEYLARALPAGRKAELIEVIAWADDPVETASSLAESMWLYDDFEALDQLVDFLQERAPDTPRTLAIQARRLSIREDYAGAISLLKIAHAKETDPDRREEIFSQLMGDALSGNLLNDAYDWSEDKPAAFMYIADSLELGYYEEAAPPQFPAIYARHEEQHPDDPWLHYFAGQASLNREDYDAAEQSFALAVERGDEDLADLAKYDLIDAIYDAGRPMDAFRTVPPQDETFRHLAQRLENDEAWDELRDLINAYSAVQTDDPWLSYFQGVVRARQGELEASEPYFRGVLQKRPEDEYLVRTTIAELFECRRKRMGVVRAFQALPPYAKPFLPIAEALARNGEWERLAELVTYHERRDGRSPESKLWSIEAAWGQRDYQKVVDLLTPWRPGEFDAAENWRAASLRDKLIRSQLQLQQFAAAESHAREILHQSGDPDLLAVVAAVREDQATLLEAADLASQISRGRLHQLYSDTDAAPYLWSERARTVREKFPPNPPWNRSSEATVVLLPNPPEISADRFQTIGDTDRKRPLRIEAIPPVGETAETLWMFRFGDDVTLSVTVGTGRYQGDAEDYAPQLNDPQLQQLVDQHQNWVAIAPIRIAEPRDPSIEGNLVRQVALALLGESGLGLHTDDPQRIFANSPELRSALSESDNAAAETRLKELGEACWLYRATADEPEEGAIDSYELKEQRRRELLTAYLARGEQDQFEVDLKIHWPYRSETLRIRVDEILARGPVDFLVRGKYQTPSIFAPVIQPGEPVQVNAYSIVDWRKVNEPAAK